MAAVSISNHLGRLQEDPDDEGPFEGLREAIDHGELSRADSQSIRQLESARQLHEARGEVETVARLIALEIDLVHDDPDFEGMLWKELGRLRSEELLRAQEAKQAYERAHELRPSDPEIEDALRRLEQTGDSWRKLANRFVEEAEQATDVALKTSLLVRAAAVVWQHKKKSRNKEVDKLFKEALSLDAAHPRAVQLYEQTLRQRHKWKELANLLLEAAEATRDREQELNLYRRAGRVLARRVEDENRAAACYERVLDVSPTDAEALAFLAGHFTEHKQWDHLVALYEDALRVRQKLDVEEGILLQIGMVHWRKREKPEEAEPYFARLRKIAPAHPAMLEFFREYLAEADPARWVSILTDAQRVVDDRARKTELAVELARTAQKTPGAMDRAIDAWKIVQRLDPQNQEAPAVLKELYRSARKWNALVEVLKSEIDGIPDTQVEAKVERLRELVYVYQNELKLDVMVVNTYNAILQLRPHDAEALAALADRYREMGRWNDLIQVLTRQAEAADDPHEKVDRYLQVAQLWLDRFANHNQATVPLKRVLELQPDNAEALQRLESIYTKKRAWQPYYELLEKQAQATSDADARLRCKVEMAKLAGDRLQRPDEAVALWREVLSEQPGSLEAVDALERLADRQKDWPVLAEALERRVELASGNDAKIKALQKLGGLYGETLKDAQASLRAWQRILEIDPANGRALRTLRERYTAARDWDSLEALYEAAGDWEGLVDVLGSTAEKVGEEEVAVELSFRAAGVFEEKLEEPQRAFRSYERVLSLDPGNLHAARALVPIYEKQEKWSRLASVLEIIADGLPEDERQERLDIWERLRVLSLESLRDGEAAFRYATQAFRLAPANAQIRERLEEAAGRAAAFDRLVDLYLERAAEAPTGEALELRTRVASLAIERLDRSELAVEQLRKVLDTRPDDLSVMDTLERIYRSEQRSGELRALWRHRAEQATDEGERWRVLQELARLEEETLGDREAAEAHYRAMLEIDASDRETLAALDRIVNDAERWEELADILHKRLEVEVDEAAQVELSTRLGVLYAETLQDVSGACEQLERVLELMPGHSQALAALERLREARPQAAVQIGHLLELGYEQTGRFDKLAEVLKERQAQTDDEEESRALRLRLAEINASKLGDAAGAYGELEAALLQHPEDVELWDRLAEAAARADQHAGLVNAYVQVAQSGALSDSERADLAARIAKLYDEALQEPLEAEPYHKQVLAHDPLDDRAFAALKKLYTDGERWEELQSLYRERIEETVDSAVKLELLLQVCFLFEEILDKPDLAIDAYQQILEQEPDHAAALRALDRLYERTERWRELAALIQRQLERAEGKDAIELQYRLGALHEGKLGQPAEAVNQYEAVLTQQPTHLRAQQALERLLGVESERQRIAALLEPIYESQGAYPELARVLEIQLESAQDVGERTDLLLRTAELYDQRLHQPKSAFEAYARAVEADPADPRAREALARIAQQRGSHRERASVLENAVEAVEGSRDLLGELLLELARLWDELDEAEAAERAYERLIDLDPDDADRVLTASRSLERIHVRRDDHARLARDVERQLRFETDDEAKRGLLVRLAEIRESVLEDAEGAVEAHRERLDLDPEDIDALLALERLYERAGRWEELVEVLRQRDEITSDAEARQELNRRIAGVYEEKLQRLDDAIAVYNDMLTSFGATPATLEALARLYEATERWEELLETMLSQLELQDDPEQRARLRFRAAELMRTRTGEVPRALETYAEVLEELPEHLGTLDALDRIMAEPEPPERIEAARIAAPRYEAMEAYDKLLAALEVIATGDEPDETLRTWRRASDVADQDLSDPSRAFGYTGNALRAGLTDPDLPVLLQDLARFAEASGRWADYVELLREIAPEIMDGDLQAEVYESIAKTARDRLNDATLAREHYAQILEQYPDHSGALDALDALHEAAGDHAALIDVLKRKAELAADPQERHRLLKRQADIFERALDDPGSAIDVLEEITAESDDAGAFEALERLYEQEGRWSDLASLYEQELDRGMGTAVELRHKLGCVHLKRLDDGYQALEQFRAAVTDAPDHEPTIEMLESMMQQPEHRLAAAQILEPGYLHRMQWPKLTEALEAQVAEEPDVEERKRLLMRLAQLHEDQLEDFEGALETYGRLFAEDPRDEENWETLSRLAKHEQRWDRLGEIFSTALEEEAIDDAVMANLAMTAARLYDERLGQLDAAAQLYRRVLEFDPEDATAFAALESAYRRMESWQPLLDLYREHAVTAGSDEERISLLHRRAKLFEAQLHDAEQAIETYREVLDVDPADEAAIGALDRLYTEAQRWEELADLLRHRIDQAAGSDDEVKLKHRLGELLVTRLDDRAAAIDVYEDVTQLDPTYQPTVSALEVLVQQPEHTWRITQVLEPIYRQSDQWKKLIAIFEARVELTDDPVERTELLGEIGRLHETRGGDLSMAFHAWARAFADDPMHDEARANVDRLAGRLDAWDDHVAAYEKALEKVEDELTAATLLTTLARVHDEKRGDPRSAIQTYERLLHADPDDPSPLDSLEALHTMVGDWRGLVDVLERKVERAMDPVERGELLRRMGSVLEELLGDRDGAIETYRRATEEDDADVISWEALDRLYSAAADAPALVEVLRRRIELSEMPQERAELGLRLARIADERLNEPSEAIEAYQRVLDDEPGNPPALEALGALYERQGLWAELLDNLKQRADLASDDDARVTLRYRAGEVLERELDDVPEALATYEEALRIEATYEPAIGALQRISLLEEFRPRASEILEPLLREQHRWDELAQLLERTVDATVDPLDRRHELRRLAEVHELGRNNLADALDALDRALGEDPADAETADELERVAAAQGAWERAADAFGARASSIPDPMDATTLYRRLARISEEELRDDARAIEAYARAAEQSDEDETLLEHLDRLYTRTERWEDLASLLERRASLTSDARQRVDLLDRLGVLREQRFDDARAAFAAYQDVIETDPSDGRALEGLERLARVPDLAADAVDVLESAYRQTGALEKIAGLYDARLGLAGDDEERMRLLQEQAHLWEQDLGQPDRALEAMRRAFELDPRDDVLLGELERLADAAGDWEPLRGLVEGLAEKQQLEPDVLRDLSLRAAGWYRERFEDAPAAEHCLRMALEADPEALDAHAQLVSLLRAQQREQELVAALRAWAGVEPDELERRERLREAAKVAESSVGDVGVAAACHEAILAMDPEDVEALDDMIRIRSAEEHWEEVLSLLHRRADNELDPRARVELRRRIAEVGVGYLGDREAGIRAHETILEEDPDDVQARRSLESLYEAAERWDDLHALLEQELDRADDPEARIGARVRLARMAEQRFGKREEALEQLRDILAERPGHVEARDELQRLLEADERWEELLELLEQRIQERAEAGETQAEIEGLSRMASVYAEKLDDAQRAIDTYERVAERDPMNAQTLTRIAELYERAEDWEGVADALERLSALQHGTDALQAALRTADIAESRLEDTARAEAALRRALELDPQAAETRDRLKTLYERAGDHAKLAEMLAGEEQRTQDKAEKLALLRRIAGLYAEELDDPASAAAQLERAVELAPDDRGVLLPLCDLYIAAGRQADAVPVLEKIVASYNGRRAKEVAVYEHRLGKALEGMGDSDAALQHYDAAFKIDLTNVPILRDLGKLCWSKGDLERAQKTFRALLLQKLGPDAGIGKADVYYYLGSIAAQQGDKMKAKSMLQRALSEQKDHADAQALLEDVKA